MDRLLIGRRPWDEALAHLRACLPHEGVGFFLGEAALRADRFVPARNAGGEHRFLVDPYDQFLAFRQARAEDRLVVAVCHSHPGGGTALSEPDRANAESWAFLQVVVALASGEAAARAAAWRCGPGGVTRVALVLEGASASPATGTAPTGPASSPPA